MTIESNAIALRVDEACKAVSIGKSNFYRMVREGKIETRLVGRRRLVPVAALRRFIEEGA